MIDQATAKQLAQLLLQTEAVKLDYQTPFTWASGWKAPIYCDNRRILSYPAARNYIRLAMSKAVVELYPKAEVIAGVATGAISWGILVADALNLPFVYVRPKPKDHGLENLVEGYLPTGARTVVIEDLISTGGSSLKAVGALREQGAEVLGLLAVYTHGFAVAEELFEEAKCPLDTLSRYEFVIEEAVIQGYIPPEELTLLAEWRKDPANWRQ